MGRELDGKGLVAQISDTEQDRLRADPATHILAVLESEHFHVHHGHSFRVATFAEIAAGANYDWILTAPNTPVRVHMFFDVTVEAETEIEIRTGPSFTGGSPVLTVFNRDRNSSTVATLVLNTTATISIPGLPLWKGKLGSGKKSGGGSRPANEIILKQGEDYLFSMINRSVSPAWISVDFNWYEITPKD